MSTPQTRMYLYGYEIKGMDEEEVNLVRVVRGHGVVSGESYEQACAAAGDAISDKHDITLEGQGVTLDVMPIGGRM